MKAALVLKCEGHKLDDFVFCSGTKTIILDLETIETTPNYVSLIQYLDGVTKLFDAPCVSMNTISSAMFKIFEMGYISEKVHKYFSYYWDMHKRCGLILECVPKEDEDNENDVS